MSICKYCGNPIEGEPVMNLDEYGNGYHHFCFVDKEFRDAQRRIYNKGRADALKWILVSEGLPKSHGVYNVTRLIDEAYITDSCFYDGNTWYDDTRINHERTYLTDVIAWMPLPESYREGGNE